MKGTLRLRRMIMPTTRSLFCFHPNLSEARTNLRPVPKTAPAGSRSGQIRPAHVSTTFVFIIFVETNAQHAKSQGPAKHFARFRTNRRFRRLGFESSI
ncbi:uncharacterized protein PHACADRAFT_251023 [Phanerochaete carnosa HHB-10118-sp]|uniref:Uncharacterized protein n=1 Tax=Phanerochaete carnosa (strain HHB-10118-sp) TaxID=650164 RepID=K5VB58_PHACS|nr:uncharacterized protein PHACADRAFT_251023 [Phanerochaete carnosa HHB-10118-sp]EKM60126.1 hypothetical protein PHACADRAFT_251023 [Phanerochaete carnosa HHB-10118-sp]